jgi:hypothetical protein
MMVQIKLQEAKVREEFGLGEVEAWFGIPPAQTFVRINLEIIVL